MWMRLQINGTTIKGKIWREGEDEPAGWDIDTTDSGGHASGAVGVFARYDSGFDWFGVGTGGDAPPAIPAAEGDARVTQIAADVLRQGDPDARVTQIAVEVLRQNQTHSGTVVIIG
jgi:hypothetical protein